MEDTRMANEVEDMVYFLRTRNFDGFQFINPSNNKPYQTINDSKFWLEATYQNFKGAKNIFGKQCQYNRIKEVFDNFQHGS
jgi:hypothetical protein